jgi:hypothetical protein
MNKKVASHQLTDAQISNYHSNATTLTLMIETGPSPQNKTIMQLITGKYISANV